MGKVTQYLKYKLLIMFVIVCLLPIIFVSYTNYNKIKTTLTNSTKENLKAIVTLKSYEIEKFYERKINDLITISTSPYVKNLIDIQNEQNSLTYNYSKKMLDEQIYKFILPREIDEVFIYTIDGKKLIDIKKNSFSSIKYLDEALEKGKDKLYISNIYENNKLIKSVSFTISNPIVDENDNLIGIAIIEVNFDRLFKQVQDYVGLGNSGETLIGQKTNDSVVIINPLKYDNNASFNRKIKIGENVGIPIQDALKGNNNTSIAIDYRGKEVIASWRYIKIANLGIVVKIDTDEIYQVSNDAKDSILISSSILLFCLVVISFFAMKNIVSPINSAERNSFIDKLTGLPNRRLLDDFLKNLVYKSKVKSNLSSILFLDLDGFKSVNDTYGHEMGDILLRNVSAELIKLIRQSDTVFRLGGDEFVILLSGIQNIENIETIAKNIVKKLNEPFKFDNIQINIGVSIGIALIDGRISPNELIKKADEAMYIAKKKGKNTYIFSDLN